MFRHFAICFVLISMFGLNGCDDVPDPSLPNEPPIARDDAVSVKQNESINVGFLLNDSDVDGDPLTVELTTLPSNGTVTVDSGPMIYTPDLYFTGTDEFGYQITDRVGHTATATVSVEVTKRETRAIFSTISGTEEKLYMLDSRDADTLIDLGQSLEAGETLLNWAISDELQRAVLLTVTDDGINPVTHRVVTVPLDDPAAPIDDVFVIDTTNFMVDGGLLVSTLGTQAIYTLDNRYVRLINLADNTIATESFDTEFDFSTLTPAFYSPVDAGYITAGTLGAAGERSAIYFISIAGIAPIAILDDAAISQSTVLRQLFGLNSMLWLTDDSAPAVPPAAYSCTTPPPQTLSALRYTQLGTLLDSTDPNVDLNEGSGMLADPTDLISYNNAPFTSSILVAACPPADPDIVQIIEIPFADPGSARVVATADDTSDGLWNIDVGVAGNNVIYVLEGDTGFRTMAIDMTGTDPVISDLTAAVPDYQTYTAGTELRVPPSVFSTDDLRWVFLAPVSDTLTRLEWLQLDTSELSTLDLPFTATNLISDGFYALVQGETGDAGDGPVALIDLNDPQISIVNVSGVLAETLNDPLNQIESAILLLPVP